MQLDEKRKEKKKVIQIGKKEKKSWLTNNIITYVENPK